MKILIVLMLLSLNLSSKPVTDNFIDSTHEKVVRVLLWDIPVNNWRVAKIMRG